MYQEQSRDSYWDQSSAIKGSLLPIKESYQIQRRDSTLWQNSVTKSNSYFVLGTLYNVPGTLYKVGIHIAFTPSLSTPLRCLSRLDRVLSRVLPHTLFAFQRHL